LIGGRAPQVDLLPGAPLRARASEKAKFLVLTDSKWCEEGSTDVSYPIKPVRKSLFKVSSPASARGPHLA